MAEIEFEQLLRDARLNATLAWAITGVVGLVAVEGFLTGDVLWGSFALAVLALVVVPPLAFFSPRTMLPWEVLLLACLPILGRAFATLDVSSRIATYLSVAALALVIAVELHTFTSVRMSPSFAVAFVAITTMAVAGVWAWARWAADIWLGTTFLEGLGHDEEAIERAIMLEFVASFIAGIVAGLFFEFYVRRTARVRRRVPDDVDLEGNR
jgi:hypothetical protein